MLVACRYGSHQQPASRRHKRCKTNLLLGRQPSFAELGRSASALLAALRMVTAVKVALCGLGRSASALLAVLRMVTSVKVGRNGRRSRLWGEFRFDNSVRRMV